MLARLNSEMVRSSGRPSSASAGGEIGAEPPGNRAEQLAAQTSGETERFAKLVNEAKVTIDRAGPLN